MILLLNVTFPGKMWLPNGDCLGGDWAGDKVTGATFYKGNFDDVPR